MKQTLTIVLIFINFSSFGQIYSEKDFIESATPFFSDSEWKRLGQLQFVVTAANGKIQISKPSYPPSGYALPKGILFAYRTLDPGLFYIPNDSSKKVFNINGKIVGVETDSIVFRFNRRGWIKNPLKGFLIIEGGYSITIFPYKDSIYYLKGADHYLYPISSSLNKIINQGDSFITSKITDFDDDALAITAYNDTILVVTHNGFYILNHWKKEKVLKDIFWGNGYPNSVAILDKENVYIGYLGGYAILDLLKKSLRFYKYNK